MVFNIVITEKGGKPKSESFEQNEITIGRVQGNDIVLPKGNISKRHSRIVLRDGKFIIVDLKSTNGTYVNGKRINSPQVLKELDKVYIGDFTLTLEMKGAGAGGGKAEEPGASIDDDDAPPPPVAAQAGARKGAPPQNPPNELENILDDDDGPLFQEEAAAAIAAADDGSDILDDFDGGGDLAAATPPPAPAPPVAAVKAAPPPAARVSEPPRAAAAVAAAPAARPAEKAPQRDPAPAPAASKLELVKAPSNQPSMKPALARAAALRPEVDFQVDLPAGLALQAREAVFRAVHKALSPDQGLPADDEANFQKAESVAERALSHSAKKFQGVSIADWSKQISAEVCGLGPLKELLDDASIQEIFVNGPHQILVKRDDKLSAVPLFFSSDEACALVLRRILAAAGLKFDAEHPVGEARLQDGTRVNAVHHAAAVKGPLVTITRSNIRSATLDDLVAEQVLSENMAAFLETCVKARRNVVLCGGPGAATGTLLSALASTISSDERLVVVEQVSRLKLPQPHVVAMEPRPLKGQPSAAGMRGLVSNALRMRPDRLIVNEVTGAEAHELCVAMGGPQDGTLFSTYASSARDCLDRFETMMRMSGLDVQAKVVRDQIASSVDVVVCLTRFADGSSRVTQVAEVLGTEVDLVTTQDIFTFKREGFDENGGVLGRFVATGTAPRFYEELQRRGESVNVAIFRE